VGGRSPATAGSRLVILVAFSACAGTSTLTTSPAPAAGSASIAPGRTVITGVSQSGNFVRSFIRLGFNADE